MLDINSAQFLRYLHSDPQIWRELSNVRDRSAPWADESQYDYAMELLRENVDYYATEEGNPFTPEQMLDVDVDAVVEMLADGYVTDGKGGYLNLEYVLNPFHQIISEAKSIGLLETKLNGRHRIQCLDMVGLNGEEPGKEEEKVKLDSLARMVDGILDNTAKAMEAIGGKDIDRLYADLNRGL